MAYGQALNADDEQKQKALTQSFDAPGMDAGATTPGGAGPQAQQTPAGTGTGFVNLQSYMNNASNDRAGDLAKASSSTLDAENKRFDEAAKPITDATNAVGPRPGNADISGAFKAATGQNGPTVQTPASGTAPGSTLVAGNTGIITNQPLGEGGVAPAPTKPGGSLSTPIQATGNPFTVGGTPPPMTSAQGFDRLNGWLNADYAGPMSVNYRPDDANAKKLAQNSDVRSALQGTYGDRIQNKPYSLGDEMLDQALFQGDAGVNKAAGETKANVDKFDATTGQRATDLAAKAQKAVNDTRQTREMTRATLGQIANKTGGQIDARIAERNARENADRQNGVIRDPNTGNVVGAPNGQVAGDWENGTGATRENTATDSERGQFSALSKLLGIDDIGSKTDYREGRTTTHAGAPAQLKTTPMDDDQRAVYQKYLNAGYTDKQAMDAAMSMQNRGAPIFQPTPAKEAPAPTPPPKKSRSSQVL